MKIKVLQMMTSYHPGGSEVQALQLTKLLHDSGRYRPYVATLEPTGILKAMIEDLELGGIQLYRLKSLYAPSTIDHLRRFASYLKENEIQIVHTHDFYTNIFGIAGAWLAGVPVRIASRRETSGRSSLYKRAERQAYRLSHAVVTNAEAVREDLMREGTPGRKIVTVYNGLNTDRVKTDLSRNEVMELFDLPKDENCRFVTIVANLHHPVKDHPTFLRAAKAVREAVSDARFLIVGEGLLIPEMQRLAEELGIARDVFFTGRCARVADLLSISDVCVLSSVAEGFSNAILEYMAAGRPSVVTNVGGAREAIDEGKTGFIVRPGDDSSMAARIVELLNNPAKARKMGELAGQIVKNKFSLAAQLKHTEELYNKLLERGGDKSISPRISQNRAIDNVSPDGSERPRPEQHKVETGRKQAAAAKRL